MKHGKKKKADDRHVLVYPDDFPVVGELEQLDNSKEIMPVYACTLCGALTATPTAHADYHQRLGQ